MSGNIFRPVANRLGIGQPSAPHPLVPVRIETKNDSLKEIVLNGGGHDQMDGVPDIYDGFGIPGIEGIDTPSQHGIKLRTITRVPEELKCSISAQTGMTFISFGMKAPSAMSVDHKNALGYWNANGIVLGSYIENMSCITQLVAAIHRHDLAVCLGTKDGRIGSDTLRLIVVSALSDEEREDFLVFDQETVKCRDSLDRHMRHWSGAGSSRANAAMNEPRSAPAAYDKMSA